MHVRNASDTTLNDHQNVSKAEGGKPDRAKSASCAELRSEQSKHRQEMADANANLKAAQDAVADAEGLLAEVFRTRATQEAKYVCISTSDALRMLFMEIASLRSNPLLHFAAASARLLQLMCRCRDDTIVSCPANLKLDLRGATCGLQILCQPSFMVTCKRLRRF